VQRLHQARVAVHGHVQQRAHQPGVRDHAQVLLEALRGLHRVVCSWERGK
jgi:hypothetical protein